MALVTLVLTGVLYPLLITGIASVAFPRQAAGSLITRNGKVIGSALIGQGFASDGYFHGRPSMAGRRGYDAAASGASNLGPTNEALTAAMKARVTAIIGAEPGAAEGAVPVDLVTASGSGLDPHISPDAAAIQVTRVSRARGLAEARVADVVRRHIEGRDLGLFGEPRVNVLLLNLDLDALSSR